MFDARVRPYQESSSTVILWAVLSQSVLGERLDGETALFLEQLATGSLVAVGESFHDIPEND